ncbi:MAG: alpha/beta hydrolase [Thermoflexales bacterium]
MSRWIKRIGIGLLIALLVVSVGFIAWTRISRYAAFPEAAALGASSARAPEGWLVFKSNTPNGSGMVFYPGGLVDAAAYAPLAQALAERGSLVVIAPMPLDLAIFGISAGDAVIRAFPEVDRWAIGGHSLGGSMAGEYVGQRGADIAAGTSRIRGVVLYGSYIQTSAGVAKLPMTGLSIYGTNDQVSKPPITPAQRLAGAPAGLKLIAIEGGNHAMFGDYGPQAGDGPQTVPLPELRRQIVDATAGFLAALR